MKPYAVFPPRPPVEDVAIEMAAKGNPEDCFIAYPERGPIDFDCKFVQDFCDYCLRVKPPSEFASRQHFDPFTLRPWLGYILILDYLQSDNDFLYRLYGSHIAAQTGWDMTGRRVSDYDQRVMKFNIAIYRECVQRKELVYSAHTRVSGRFDCDWRRITCPVLAPHGIQVVACNYPMERAKEDRADP